VADATAREIAGLKAAGATMIDIEDPAVAASPKHIELAREAYGRFADPDLALTLVTYFFPVDSILESLASFPVGAIAIDVRSRDTTAFDRLDAFRTQDVLLGVVDARNTRLETADEVARYAERALKLVPQERLVLATTTSLEYLPRDVARGKLTALVEGARLVTGERVPA
jgi:5-methyltetrahydropteroyltriglutamate--homocysteine methyltransferase